MRQHEHSYSGLLDLITLDSLRKLHYSLKPVIYQKCKN